MLDYFLDIQKMNAKDINPSFILIKNHFILLRDVFHEHHEDNYRYFEYLKYQINDRRTDTKASRWGIM